MENLDSIVQKLEDAGVNVDLGDADEHGRRWTIFKGPDNVKIVLGGLDQTMSDEETDSQDGNTERPSIGEKVRFWEEQDKINQALIPRVMEMHEIVTDLHKRTANISGQIAAAEARVLQQMQEQVSGMVNDLMPDIEKRLIQLVKEEIKSQIDQNLSGIRRTAYAALVLATSRIRPHTLPMGRIAMQSANLLSELEQIPLRREHDRYTYEDVVKQSGLMRNDLFAIEVSAGIEDTFSTLFDARNVTDDLFEAYSLASPGVAADHSLYDRYVEMVNQGERSVGGFISNIKGKLGELRIQEHLQQEFPGYSFQIADAQNQPDWDILATGPDGTEVPIQVKIGDEEYAGEVLARMQEDPDVAIRC